MMPDVHGLENNSKLQPTDFCLEYHFSALGSETEELIILVKAKDKICLTCSFQKVIRTLSFRGSEKFDNSFYFKVLGIV